MNDEQRQVCLGNILATADGRIFIIQMLADCGVSLGDGISFRSEKTAHEFGLDLLHEIMYHQPESLKKLISEQKTLKEVIDGRGSKDD